ncbi:acylphosphatase [Methanospirillum sp.]
MQSQITIEGSRVHEVGFRLNLLQYAKKLRFSNFEAFNDIKESEELVIILVEGDEAKIDLLVQNIQAIKPELAVVHDITVQPYTGQILPLATFSQDLQMEQMAKSVPILADMRDLQKETIGMQKEMIGMQKETLGLQKETISLQKEMNGMQKEALALHKESISMHKESLKKQDETIAEIRGLRDDFRSSVNDRLTKIEESLQTIKVALEHAKILG